MSIETRLIRPGSATANSIALRKAMSGSVDPIGFCYWWVQRVRFSDFNETDGSEVITLNTQFPQNAFPANAFLSFSPFAYIDLIQVFAGGTVSAATMILGVSGDTNGLVEQVDVFTGSTLERKYAPGTVYATSPPATLDQATAMSPLLQLDTTTGTIDELTSGIVDVYIPFYLAPTRRPINGF